MSVSKRLRYEVLRRDNYTCRYCGRSAPQVVLHVDHIQPAALGGTDDPSNLIAACADCNSGKSSMAPEATMVASAEAVSATWQAAMAQAIRERQARARNPNAQWSDEGLCVHFDTIWTKYWLEGQGGERIYFPRPTGWMHTITRLVECGLSLSDISELIRVAAYSGSDDAWRYFCKCAWNRHGENQQRAAELVRAGDV